MNSQRDDIGVYSSFENSKWHAFWHAGRTNTGNMEDQELCIYYLTDYTGPEGEDRFVYELMSYGDMTQFGYIDDLLFTIAINSGASPEDMLDLTDIIHDFIVDVKEEYGE